jgi:hypothetical protein
VSRIERLIMGEPQPPARRRCAACEIKKPIDEFAVDKAKRRKRKRACKSCDAAGHRERYAQARDGVVRPYARRTEPAQAPEAADA